MRKSERENLERDLPDLLRKPGESVSAIHTTDVHSRSFATAFEIRTPSVQANFTVARNTTGIVIHWKAKNGLRFNPIHFTDISQPSTLTNDHVHGHLELFSRINLVLGLVDTGEAFI